MFKSLAFKIVYTVLMFVAGLLLSNLALPEYFGVVSLLILNASLFSLVTGLGADTMILHMLGNKKWNMPQAVYFMWRSVALQVLLFVVLEGIAYASAGVSLLSNEDGATYFLLDAFYFCGLLLTEKFVALLYADHRATAGNIAMTVIATFYLVLLSLLYWTASASIKTVLWIFAAQSFLQGLALSVLFFSRHSPARLQKTDRSVRYFLGLSALVMVTNVVQLLAYRVDYWLIKSFYSNTEVGLYAQANKFANLIWLLPNMVTQLLIPRFISMEKKDVSRLFRVAFLANAVTLVGAVVFAHIIFRFLLVDDYRAALPAFHLMLPGYFFWAAVIYFAGYFSWKGWFRLNLWGSIACLLIIFIADLLLIPKLSINGAAIANSVAYTAVFVFYLFMLKKNARLPARELLRWQKNDLQKTFRLLK